ncbi:pyridoxamine 5'-phosphate oxidase family protein [Bifidobacterium sp. ESL0798]|uniref:pyridoxamine 5'-phosphate oxidase family protein n=1 Tax=Bifidobacterium sp. ESL0798 TaxID=2983235 RepID=UPI0023F9C180|nr:pyridoxamine 5'-phosphate oxidase family protein [Bifidobacterium sp. ESL0798]WEV74091.1 pyridoxamine 5'-phosphate oxidase family protein [Bifidobacterium sp. ESL0798]
MNTKEEFYRILAEQTEMALATSVDNIPDARIVNFYFDPADNILYFATFKGNNKVQEITANAHVAFTTIPHDGNAHVKAQGIARPSKKSIDEIADEFVAKIPAYANTLRAADGNLLLYEISFDTATVTKDLSNIDTYTIKPAVV